MKQLLVLCMFFAFVVSLHTEQQLRQQFNDYVTKYNKKYVSDSIEYNRRYANFKESIKRSEEKQQKTRNAKYGLNKYSDMSVEEFKHFMVMPKESSQFLAQSCLANGVEAPHLDVSALPDSFDWRTKGVVTEVKDQGQCGSCWAFSTIGNIESQWALKGNKLTSFSEQLLVDCSTGCCNELNQTVCNSGCNGGWQWNAYIDIMSWKGVETESEYPYTGTDGTCNRQTSDTIAPIKNYTCLSGPNGADETQMQAYLVAHGPLAVALNADELQDYYSGVINPFFSWECDPTTLDHAVLIVGYGVENSEIWGVTPYWIVKNSWGSDFGENGYFRIGRGSGVCGINNAVSSVLM